jgi:hypothetical protein
MSEDTRWGWANFGDLPLLEEPQPPKIVKGDVILYDGLRIVVDEVLEPPEGRPWVESMRVHVEGDRDPG